MASGTLGGFVIALPFGWLSDLFRPAAEATIAAATTALAMIAPLGAAPWLLYLYPTLFGATFILPTASLSPC